MRTTASFFVFAWLLIVTAASSAWGGDDPRSVIVGKIVDEAKNPVAGATVMALGRKEATPVKSAADGSFRLSLNKPPRDWIYAKLLVQGPKATLGFLSVQQEKPAPVEVVVKAPAPVMVRVVDAANKPVAGSTVDILAAYAAVASGRTDANGRWSALVPVDAAQASIWAVYAFKGSVGFDYLASERLAKDGARHLPQEIGLKLDGARTLRVKTVDAAGKPVAGVEVGPWYIQKPGRADKFNLSGASDVWRTTDKDGIALFDWLPQQFDHGLPFIVSSDKYYVADHATSLTADSPSQELTIPLLSHERLSGRVTHADGAPAAGIIVRAQGQGAGHHGFHGTAKTDADGRYSMQVYAEQAYVIAVADEKWAAPYKGGLVIRAGKPADGIDFVLGPSTRVHGRVTVGKDARPVPDTQIGVEINLGQIPKELVAKGDRIYRPIRMWISTHTDKDGRYELFLGPGQYELSGPPRTDRQKITIAAKDQPRAVAHDFLMPRPETGPLSGRVVDVAGKPVAAAIVRGMYASHQARRWFRDIKTGPDGKFNVERSLDPLVLHARTADGKDAGIARINADAATVELVLRPTITATGRLLDLAGKPIAQAKLDYGIRIYMGEEENSPFSTSFGGAPVTGPDGKFTLTGLMPGEKYDVSLPVANHYEPVAEFIAKGTMAIDLGDRRVDTEPRKPYVPPTPAERLAKAFASSAPAEQLAKVLVEAKREYTRPLLLFGQRKDSACVDLFRLFNERSDDEDGSDARHSPSGLRWEFELAVFDTNQADVLSVAEKLGVKAGKGVPPTLAILNANGVLAATYPLVLSDKKTLDAKALTAFLLKHKLPQRDAERMLAEALKTAKAEDKRVFFIASASWCGPCRMLGRFMDPFKAELNRHYVFVKLDISRDEHAREVVKRFQGDSDGGVPWYAILDRDAKTLITSNVPELKRRGKAPNMGFPTEPLEIEHFMKMLAQTAPRLAEPQANEIRSALNKK